jgi:hypothetical protein
MAGVVPRIDGLPKSENLILKRRRLRKKASRKPGYFIQPPKPSSWVSIFTGYQGLLVQLFTESGRVEYDLEGLWTDSRVVDSGIIEKEPRKAKTDEEVEKELDDMSNEPEKPKKLPLSLKKLQQRLRKREKKLRRQGTKRRWTKEEKDKARQKRMDQAARVRKAGFDPLQFPQRNKPTRDLQQRRLLHT